MDIEGFEKYLKKTPNKKGSKYSDKAIATRIKNLKKAEEILGNVDTCVENKESMYNALVKLESHDIPEHEHLQTALRRYWEFKNGSEFPKKREYEKEVQT